MRPPLTMIDVGESPGTPPVRYAGHIYQPNERADCRARFFRVSAALARVRARARSSTQLHTPHRASLLLLLLFRHDCDFPQMALEVLAVHTVPWFVLLAGRQTLDET